MTILRTALGHLWAIAIIAPAIVSVLLSLLLGPVALLGLLISFVAAALADQRDWDSSGFAEQLALRRVLQ
jgi:hypothetical protein